MYSMERQVNSFYDTAEEDWKERINGRINMTQRFLELITDKKESVINIPKLRALEKWKEAFDKVTGRRTKKKVAKELEKEKFAG